MARLQLIAALLLSLALPVSAQHVRTGAGTSVLKSDLTVTTSDTIVTNGTTTQTPGIAWTQNLTNNAAASTTEGALFRLLFQPQTNDTGIQRAAMYGYTETKGSNLIGSDIYAARFRSMHMASANFDTSRTARLYGIAATSYNGYIPSGSPGGTLGANNSQFGTYSSCFVQGASASTAFCYGSYNQAYFDLGTVGEMTGSNNYAVANGTAGPVTGSMYGSQNHVLITANASLVVPQAIGVYADIVASNPVQYTTAYGFYAATIQGVAGSKYSYYAADVTAPSAFLGGAQTPFVSTVAASSILASATTIAPTNGVHHISGTVAIATITVPATCGATCTLYLIPDAAFTTTTAGNIRIASTAVVSRALILVWDGTKWNPSY